MPSERDSGTQARLPQACVAIVVRENRDSLGVPRRSGRNTPTANVASATTHANGRWTSRATAQPVKNGDLRGTTNTALQIRCRLVDSEQSERSERGAPASRHPRALMAVRAAGSQTCCRRSRRPSPDPQEPTSRASGRDAAESPQENREAARGSQANIAIAAGTAVQKNSPMIESPNKCASDCCTCSGLKPDGFPRLEHSTEECDFRALERPGVIAAAVKRERQACRTTQRREPRREATAEGPAGPAPLEPVTTRPRQGVIDQSASRQPKPLPRAGEVASKTAATAAINSRGHSGRRAEANPPTTNAALT